MRVAFIASLALLLPGCNNACQDICLEMARFAERNCGITVPDDEVDACIEAQAGEASKDDRQACREFGNQSSIEEEWGCEELESYFSGPQDDTDVAS